MANYQASARSNYFRVKDATAFKAWAMTRGMDVHESKNRASYFALFPNAESDSGSFRSIDEETGDDIDLAQELSRHLADDSIAILTETGSEKLRYLVGFAIAVNARGTKVKISLEQIYERARRKFGKAEITEAEY